MLGQTLPNQILEFEKQKFAELQKFNKTYQALEPNLQGLTARVKIISDQLEKSGKGVTKFTYGKDFTPLMKDDQLHHLSMLEKLEISDQLKVRSEDSIYEHMMAKLNEIKTEEEWSNEETGHNLAEMVKAGGGNRGGMPMSGGGNMMQ